MDEVREAGEVFLTARRVRCRYGNASNMWLWRRERDERSGFPKPIRINGRRFWRLNDLVAWERSLEEAPNAA
jgi:predicted DNA-binding transcriptional regulator AlpA